MCRMAHRNGIRETVIALCMLSIWTPNECRAPGSKEGKVITLPDKRQRGLRSPLAPKHPPSGFGLGIRRHPALGQLHTASSLSILLCWVQSGENGDGGNFEKPWCAGPAPQAESVNQTCQADSVCASATVAQKVFLGMRDKHGHRPLCRSIHLYTHTSHLTHPHIRITALRHTEPSHILLRLLALAPDHPAQVSAHMHTQAPGGLWGTGVRVWLLLLPRVLLPEYSGCHRPRLP
jgi:hypothetical protein